MSWLSRLCARRRTCCARVSAIAARGAAVPLIAKLEKPQAVENLDAILRSADGVMVARGDLGVEVAPEKVPLIQKQIIRARRDRGGR